MTLLDLAVGGGSVFDELDRLHREVFGWGDSPRGAGWRGEYPPVNARATEDEVVLDAELPGIDPKQVEISLEDGVLKLSGSHEAGAPEGEVAYHLRERAHGNFTRLFRLPFRADSGNVRAQYKNGMLRIAVPRMEADKPRKVAIEAA